MDRRTPGSMAIPVLVGGEARQDDFGVEVLLPGDVSANLS